MVSDQEDSGRLPDGTGLLPSVEPVPVSPLRAAIPSADIIPLPRKGERPVYGWQIDSALTPEDDPNGPAWAIIGYAPSPWEAGHKTHHQIPWPHGGYVIPWRSSDGRKPQAQAQIAAPSECGPQMGSFGRARSQENRRPHRVNTFETDEAQSSQGHNGADRLNASAIEARQGGDGEAGSVHESAAPKADAQPSSEPTP